MDGARYLQLFYENFTQGNSTVSVERDAFQSGLTIASDQFQRASIPDIYIYIYFYFPINALPSTRSLVQIAYYGSGYVFQVAFFSLLLSSFVLSTKNFTYLNFQILRKFFGVRTLLLHPLPNFFFFSDKFIIANTYIYIQIGHNKHPLQNSIRI